MDPDSVSIRSRVWMDFYAKTWHCRSKERRNAGEGRRIAAAAPRPRLIMTSGPVRQFVVDFQVKLWSDGSVSRILHGFS